MRILAVDDEEFILELLPKILDKIGIQDVTVAASAAAAIEILDNAELPFDCLILDIRMPEMDGIELCKIVRKMPAYFKTPIIMLTAMSEKSFIERAFAAGATDYATKPFDIVELGARVRNAKQLNSARQESYGAAVSQKIEPKQAGNNRSFDLSFAAKIEYIEGVIDYLQLGSYLKQLSRSGLLSTQIFAIKIDQIETIYTSANSSEFLYALTEVADAIAEAVKNDRSLIAYAGDGYFVCVFNSAALVDPREMESDIQNFIYEKDLVFDNGDPFDIEISVGNPMRPRFSATQRLDMILDRAIVRADTRSTQKIGEPTMPNIRSRAILTGPHRVVRFES